MPNRRGASLSLSLDETNQVSRADRNQFRASPRGGLTKARRGKLQAENWVGRHPSQLTTGFEFRPRFGRPSPSFLARIIRRRGAFRRARARARECRIATGKTETDRTLAILRMRQVWRRNPRGGGTRGKRAAVFVDQRRVGSSEKTESARAQMYYMRRTGFRFIIRVNDTHFGGLGAVMKIQTRIPRAPPSAHVVSSGIARGFIRR